jgi:hypothetical protein
MRTVWGDADGPGIGEIAEVLRESGSASALAPM